MKKTLLAAVLLAAAAVLGTASLAQQPSTWTTPRTWTSDEIVTAAMLNTHVRDNLLWLRGAFDADGRVLNSRLGSGSPATGQVLIYNGTEVEWNFPFEFPTTVSGRDVATSATVDNIKRWVSVTTSTIRIDPRATLTVRATGTVRKTAAGSGRNCIVTFTRPTDNLAGSSFGSTTVLTGNDNGPLAFDVTATSTISDTTVTGNAVPVVLVLHRSGSGPGCQADAGTTLTLSV